MEETTPNDEGIFNFSGESITKNGDTKLSSGITGRHVDSYGYVPPDRIKRKDIEGLYRRDLIVNRRIKKELEDLFGEVPIIESESDELKDAVWNFLFDRGGLYDRLRQAAKAAYLDGTALVYLNYGDDDISEEPRTVDRIVQMGVIYEDDIRKPVIEDDITSPNYNEIVGYEVFDDQTIVHPTRIIDVTFDRIYREMKGIGRLEPEFDNHMLRKTILEDASRAYHQNAAGIKIIEVPPREQLSKTDMEYLKGNIHEFRGTGEMTVPHDTKFHHPAPKISDPTPFLEPLVEQGIGMPYTILSGVQEGAVTGSETNLKLYYKEIQNRRENYLDVWIMDIIKFLQEKDYFPDGDINLDWGDITDIPEDVKSSIEFKRARAAKSMVEMGIIDSDEAREYLGFEGRSGGTPSESVEEEPDPDDRRPDHDHNLPVSIEDRDRVWDDLDDDDVKKIQRQLSLPSEGQLVNRYEAKLMDHMAELQDEWLDELSGIAAESDSLIDQIKKKLPWGDYTAEFSEVEDVITAVIDITGIGEARLRMIFEEIHIEGYMKGYNSVADLHGSPLIDEVTGYADTWISNNATLRASYKTDEWNNAIRQTVVNSLRDGDTFDDLERVLGDELRGYEHNLETLARTETMNSINNGRISAYQDMNVEKGTIMAVDDDRTCEECMLMDGMEFRLEELRELIPVHPNCRCVIVASRDFRGVNL